MAPLHSESCQSKRITSRRNKQRLLQQNRHEGKLSLPSSVAHTRAREISFCDFGCARRPRSRRRGSCAQRHTLSPRSGWWATSTAVAAGRCRGFRFEFCGCGSGMELTRSGRSGMRAPGWRELRGRLRRTRMRPLLSVLVPQPLHLPGHRVYLFQSSVRGFDDLP
jgi:hypothetical protein